MRNEWLARGVWWEGLVVAVAFTLQTLCATMAVAEVLTLEQALARLLTENPTLRTAAAEVEVARGRLLQAGVIPANPVVSAEGARRSVPPEIDIDYGVGLAQEIEVGGQRQLRTRAAEYDVARAEHALADRQRTLEAEVRRKFAGLVAAERRRTLAEESAQLAERLAVTARRRAHAGDVGEIEVRLAQIEETRARQAVTAADAERVRAAAQLGSAIGADPQETLTVASDSDGEAIAAPPAAAADILIAARPDLAAARAERARLEAEAQVAQRRGSVPNPTLGAFFHHEMGNENIVGGLVSVPLPVWNREQGTQIALRSAASAAADEVERLMKEIPRQVRLALARRAAATDAWTRYQHEAVPAARAARELIERAYAAGYLGLPDVLVQQDRLLQVRAAAIATWLDLREAEADLIEAVGEEPK
jgi:cobalt-zinc-cadmium efflux system outer membrane protein